MTSREPAIVAEDEAALTKAGKEAETEQAEDADTVPTQRGEQDMGGMAAEAALETEEGS